MITTLAPMVLLCGVFFPVAQLPQGFQLFTPALALFRRRLLK